MIIPREFLVDPTAELNSSAQVVYCCLCNDKFAIPEGKTIGKIEDDMKIPCENCADKWNMMQAELEHTNSKDTSKDDELINKAKGK